ncbi:MAG: DUF4276 family protein [Desulfobacula sp.]|jgi:hypothetical protein|nr:DUF4276 family protein [Desulfobacula sp.]
MISLVFFLEEPSAKEMLKGLLPRFLPPDWSAQYVVFEGKQDLEKQLPRKLSAWQLPNCRFVVLRDKDNGDCILIKQGIFEKCKNADKKNVLIRIAIHELESWYLGDLAAVETGLFIKKLTKKQNSKKYRAPDRLANPVQELVKLTSGKYQKMSGSKAIGPHLSLENNCSESFNQFISGLKRVFD